MSATPTDNPVAYQALDECHEQIRSHLAQLAALAQQIAATDIDDVARQQAGVIEAFFSSTSRQHHAQEEKDVFPLLLISSDLELVALVRSLQQDHGWLEENWLELGPQLRAMASGNGWFDEAEFQHGVDVFMALYLGHIEAEETRIYPECRSRLAQAAANRTARAPR